MNGVWFWEQCVCGPGHRRTVCVEVMWACESSVVWVWVWHVNFLMT